jgi:hypothetical protein
MKKSENMPVWLRKLGPWLSIIEHFAVVVAGKRFSYLVHLLKRV